MSTYIYMMFVFLEKNWLIDVNKVLLSWKN